MMGSGPPCFPGAKREKRKSSGTTWASCSGWPLRYTVKMTGPLLNTQSFLKGPLDFDGSPTPDNLTLILP